MEEPVLKYSSTTMRAEEEYFVEMIPTAAKVLTWGALVFFTAASAFFYFFLRWGIFIPVLYLLLGLYPLVRRYILFPRHKIRQKTKQLKLMNNGEIPPNEFYFGDKIQAALGSSKTELDYSLIKKVVRMKTCYAVMLDKQMGIPIDPDCFVNGTIEDFIRLLREKNPAIQFKL